MAALPPGERVRPLAEVPAARSPERPPTTGLANLPAQVTAFVGREALLDAVRARRQ